MVKKVNKSLVLLVKIFVLVSLSVILSCSFRNEAKPLTDDDTVDADITDTDTSEADTDTSDTNTSDTDTDDTETNDTDAENTDTDDSDETDDTDDDIDTPTDTEEPEECEEEEISSVVIGTYNTHLFFDKVCDTGHCSSSDFESVLSESEYNTKVSDLAESIHEIGADIILLQEVEKDSCLQDLFGETGTYQDCFLGEKETVDTAVMTKGKITYKNKHPEQIECAGCEGGKTTFSRAFLETHIELGCRKIIVFSAHFKSKADDDTQRRLAEAAAAAKILKKRAEEHPEALIVMGGDLNDEPGSDTLEYFENDSAFLRVASELSLKDQATYYYSGEAVALDHIFWVKTAGGKYKTGSAEVVKDAPSWYSLGSSDHAALKATFEF